MKEENEFESLEEEAPEQTFQTTPKQDMISAGSAGVVYDWNTAPEGVKAPPRVDMDGKEVIIKKAEIILPPMSKPWDKTRKGDKEIKYCTFALYYDFEGQQEFYSGVRVFKRDDNKYSHPTITKDRKSQASRLMGTYADFKGKDINEVSIKEFLAFLNSKPKAKIKAIEYENPETEEMTKKNMVVSFI